jgi:DMSO/TMAO reductase YedYZ heme-binding membrane subunit
MTGSIAVLLIWLREILWNFVRVGKSGTVRPPTLKNVLIIVLTFPLYLTGFIDSVWLFYQGWEGFARAVLLCAEASFGFGFFLAFVYLIAYLARERAEKRSGPQELLS